MENLRTSHNEYLLNLETNFERELINEIDWEEQLLFIKGSRGVGKTTLILQHIKQKFGFGEETLFVSMDNLNILDTSIFDIAKQNYQTGGKYLFIDEIHKYNSWSIELKNIRDQIKKLKVTVSGSSILNLYKGTADLSRRAVSYSLRGLSFREFINIQHKINLKSWTLEEILQNHINIVDQIMKIVNPLTYFKSYLEYGYYPFYLEGTRNFHHKLNNSVIQVIESDIPLLYNLEPVNLIKVKKLLYNIATSVPFQPNSSKLAQSLEMNRQTLNTYLQYLDQSEIISLLWESNKSYSLISKPEKIYLQNPNLCYLVPASLTNTGNLRETFFMNQVSHKYSVSTAKKGDFLVDNKFIFEIGGDTKSFRQIVDLPNSYIALDNELIGRGNKIPLWLFGFLY